MVKIIVLLCLSWVQILNPTDYSASRMQKRQLNMRRTQGNPSWHPAIYRGLIIGQSNRADMLRVSGAPEWSGPPEDQPENDPNAEIWYEYQRGGEFPGKLTVIIDARSTIVERIDLYPKNLSKEEAIKHFGDDYII